MGKFIFRAHSSNGELAGVQEAATAAEAVAQLESQGLTDVRLQSHVLAASQPLQTHGLSDSDYARNYRYFQTNQGWTAFLKAFLRQNWWLWPLALAMAVWCVTTGDLFWAALALALPIVLLGWGAWKYRDAQLFNQVLAACARGQWQAGKDAIEVLRRRVKDPAVQMELAVHEACILARENQQEAAQAVLDEWKPLMDNLMPGMYVAHQARLALARRDFAAVCELHRQAMEATGGDAAMTLDYALMEARYGASARAHCVLLEVSAATLPEYGYAFLPWVEGVVALRQQRTDEALEKLQQAMSGLQVFADNPAIWPTLAMMSSDLGLALLAKGQPEAANGVVAAAWPVLSVHGDPDDLALFRDRFSLPA